MNPQQKKKEHGKKASYLSFEPPQVIFVYDSQGVTPAEVIIKNLINEHVAIKVRPA